MKALITLYLIFVVACVAMFLYRVPLHISGTITMLAVAGMGVMVWFNGRRT